MIADCLGPAACRIFGGQSATASTLHEPEKKDNRMAVQLFTIDRDTHYLLPPTIKDYLPEDHLARFVAEIVDRQRGALDRKPETATANSKLASLRVLPKT